jgi:heme a synthase
MALRALSLATLATACLQLVVGGIVRITGSGMACGDHWPRCNGAWLPPMNRPDLIIELAHRYLSVFLGLLAVALVAVALVRRAHAGVGGRGGVLRPAVGALLGVIVAGGIGGYSVRVGNSPHVGLLTWPAALSVRGFALVATMRLGMLGGRGAAATSGSTRTARASAAAAALAFAAVLMGGLTAKVPGAAVACLSFPLCGSNPAALPGTVHVQYTHRILAFVLFFHLVGLLVAVRRRATGEAPVVIRAAWAAVAVMTVQLLVAGALVGMQLPPALRALHQATGVAVWLVVFALAYLARIAARDEASGTVPSPVRGAALAHSGGIR